MGEVAFESVAAKLERARLHLNALYGEITAFYNSKPYEFPIERNPETGEHIVRVRILREPPTLDWGLMLGDYLHNLRSTLDHLVWQLVLLNESEPRRSNQFPIALDRASYLESRGRRESMRERMLHGVADSHRAAIDAVQPYHAGDRAELTALGALRRLSNIDKHQVIHVATVAAEEPDPAIDFRAVSGTPGAVVEFEARTGVLQDGAEILRIRFRPPDAQMHVKPSGPIGVSFGNPPLTDEELGDLLTFVQDFVAGMAPSFGLTPVRFPPPASTEMGHA